MQFNVFKGVVGVLIIGIGAWCLWRKKRMEKREVQRLVEEIISKLLCLLTTFVDSDCN